MRLIVPNQRPEVVEPTPCTYEGIGGPLQVSDGSYETMWHCKATEGAWAALQANRRSLGSASAWPAVESGEFCTVCRP